MVLQGAATTELQHQIAFLQEAEREEDRLRCWEHEQDGEKRDEGTIYNQKYEPWEFRRPL